MKKFPVLIFALTLCITFCFSFSMLSYAVNEVTPDKNTQGEQSAQDVQNKQCCDQFDKNDNEFDKTSLAVHSGITVFSLLFSCFFNWYLNKRNYDQQRFERNISKIDEAFSTVQAALDTVINIFGEKDSEKNVKEYQKIIKPINEKIFDYCSGDAVKVAEYYLAQMNKIQFTNKSYELNEFSSAWFIGYICLLHSVLKYETTGLKIPPEYLMAAKFKNIAGDNFYNKLKAESNKIVKEANISKKYSCK